MLCVCVVWVGVVGADGLSSISTNHTNPGLSPWGSSKQILPNVPSGHGEQKRRKRRRRCVVCCVCAVLCCVLYCICVYVINVNVPVFTM